VATGVLRKAEIYFCGQRFSFRVFGIPGFWDKPILKLFQSISPGEVVEQMRFDLIHQAVVHD